MKSCVAGRNPLSTRRNLLLLTSILLLAAVLRFNNINQPLTDHFSWRQASTAMMAHNFYHKSWNIFYPQVNWTGKDPGYQGREFQTLSYIAALLYVLVGEHVWVGRSVAAVFGLWGIFALYQLARRVWDEERAILTAAVMALLPGSVVIERSFLPDPVMVALMTTSVWMLVAYLQTDRLRFLWLAGVIGAWGILSKPPGLVVGFAMIYATVTILRFRHKLNSNKVALIGLVAGLALVPFIAYYLWALHLGRSYPPYHVAGEGMWLWNQGWKQWLGEKYFFSSLSRHFSEWIWTTPIIVLVALGVIFPFFWPSGEEPRNSSVSEPKTIGSSAKAPWLFYWWILGIIPYYLIGAKELVSNPWNFHIINPAAAALSSYAIITAASFVAKYAGLARQMLVKLTTIAVCLIAVAVFGTKSALITMYYPAAQQGYELGLALRQVSERQDLVLTMANTLGDPVVLYYSQRSGWLFPPPGAFDDFIELPQDDKESIRVFEELRAEGAGWLGIVAEQEAKLQREHPLLLAYFQGSSRLYERNPKWVIYSVIPGATGAQDR